MLADVLAALVAHPVLAGLGVWALLALGVASDDADGNTLTRAAAMPWVLRVGAVMVGLFVAVRMGVVG